jgi:hypothetical protein
MYMTCLASRAKGDKHHRGASPFYLIEEKRFSRESSPLGPPSAHSHVPVGTCARTCDNGHAL